MKRAVSVPVQQENPAMIAARRALAESIMAFLMSRGVRPTPHRYAVVSYLADCGVLDEDATTIRVGDGTATVGRAMLRRVTELLTREGIVDADPCGAAIAYRLRPVETWGVIPPGVEGMASMPPFAAAS